MSSNPYLDLVKGATTPTKTVTSRNPYLDLVSSNTKTPLPVKASVTTKNAVPAGATKITVPSGNEAYKTPSGSILEFMPDGTRQVTLAGQFGGGAYTTDPKNPNKIINTGHTTYGGDSSVAGKQRDDIIPVGLGGLNSNPTNIRLEKDLPQNKQSQFIHTPTDAMETKLAQDVKSGKTPLGQARVQNIITKQNEIKPTPSQSTVGNFGRSLGEDAVTATQLPKKTFYDPFAHPSDQTKQVESTLPTGNLLQRIAKNVSKPVIRATMPLVEGPANLFADRINTAQQAKVLNNTPIQTVGKQAQSPIDPTMRASNSSAGENVNDFLTLFGLGLALGAPSVIHEVTSGVGDLLVNKESSAVITPKDLSTKLQTGEIKTPEGQQLAQHLIDTNSSIEIKGTESRGGVTQKVGEAIGGKEKPTTPQIRIVQGGAPVEAPDETPFSRELKKLSSAEPQTPEQIQQQKLDSQRGSVNPGAVATDIKAGAQKAISKVNDVQQFIKDTNKDITSSKNIEDNLDILKKNDTADKAIAIKLLKNTDISPSDAEAIYHYEEDKSIQLTPKQQEIYDTRIKPLADASSKIAEKLKPTGLVSDENYTPRYIAGKGGIMDKLQAVSEGAIKLSGGAGGKSALLNKSAKSLKTRTMKAVVDSQGNRQVVAIKGGRVTGFNNKNSSDLGNLKIKSNEQLLNEDIKPLQGKLTTLQKKLDGIGQIKIKDPVSQSRIDNLYQELNIVSKQSINLAEENSPLITKDIKAKTTDALKALGDLKEKMGERIVNSAETPKPYFNYEKEIPALEKKITDTQTRIEQLNVKSKDNLIARRDQAEKTRLMAQAKKLGERLKTLESVKKASDITNIQGRIKAIQKKMVGLSNVMSEIESKYNPDELNNKKFLDKNGKTYKITEATTKEIEQHTNLKYHKNVLANRVLNYLDLRAKERAVQFLTSMEESPEFKEFAHKTGEGLEPEGYKRTQLAQFRNYTFSPHVAAALDKFAGSDDPLNALTAANSFLRATMFFLNLGHVFNVGTSAFIGQTGALAAHPMTAMSLGKNVSRAIKAVMNTNNDYIEMLRAGAPLMSVNAGTEDLNKAILDRIKTETESNPHLQDIRKILGKVNPYHISERLTWLANDIANMVRIYDEMDSGKTMAEAIKEVAKELSNYRLSVNAFGSPAITKFISNPNVTMFASYHYSMVASYAHMAKELITGDVKEGESKFGKESMAGRRRFLGKALAMGAIAIFTGAVLDKVAQAITKNKNAKVRYFGQLTIPYHIYEAVKGNENFPTALQAMFTPASATKELLQLGFNKDLFTGQPLITDSLFKDPVAFSKEIANSLVEQITPINQANQVTSGKKSLPSYLGGFFGISTPKNSPGLVNVQNDIYTTRPTVDKQVKALYLQGQQVEADQLIKKFNDNLLKDFQQAAQEGDKNLTEDQIKKQASASFISKPSVAVMKNYKASQAKSGLDKLLKPPSKTAKPKDTPF